MRPETGTEPTGPLAARPGATAGEAAPPLMTDTNGLMRPTLVRLFAVLVMTGTALLLALSTYVDPNTFTVLDWAINYAGGFVRRGLGGAALGWVSAQSGIATIHLIFATNLALYAVFLFACTALLARLGFAPALAFLVYSPFLLTYQISSWASAGRKEVAFLAAFSVLMLVLARARSERATLVAFTAFAVLLPALVLLHEALFLYAAWALAAAIALGVAARHPFRLAALALPAVAAMAASLLWSGSQAHVTAICASLQDTLGSAYLESACASRSTAVIWLARDTADGIAAVGRQINTLVVGVPAILILISLAFLPLRPALGALPGRVRRRLAIGAGLALVATLPLFVVAFDWGRFIALNAICLSLVVLMVLARHPETHRHLQWRPAIPLVLVYALFWSVQYKPLDMGTGLTSLVGGGYVVDYTIRLTGGP